MVCRTLVLGKNNFSQILSWMSRHIGKEYFRIDVLYPIHTSSSKNLYMDVQLSMLFSHKPPYQHQKTCLKWVGHETIFLCKSRPTEEHPIRWFGLVWCIIGGYSRPHYSLLPDVLLVGQSGRWSGDTPTFLTNGTHWRHSSSGLCLHFWSTWTCMALRSLVKF